MNRRTFYLLILMGIVFAAWFGDMAYRGLIEEPAEMRQKELARIANNLNAAKKTIVDTANAIDQLELLERISLPYDPELARSAYQDWLLDLVQAAELTGASVDAAQPISVKIKDREKKTNKEIFLRYTFALRARGSLQQVVRFLFDFYQGGHLHKINTISLTPIGVGREVDLNVTIEALGLSRCDRESTLSVERFQRLGESKFNDYKMIARRNLFARHGDSALRDVILSAITISNGSSQAWFKNEEGEVIMLSRGELLDIAAHRIEIIDIVGEVVLLDLDGRIVKMRAGDSVQKLDMSRK